LCGLLLVPVLSAVRGAFPLNGTYFQVGTVLCCAVLCCVRMTGLLHVEKMLMHCHCIAAGCGLPCLLSLPRHQTSHTR
jgi:hypothetical protein